MYNYTELTFTELVSKIENSRFWDLPKMVAEAFRRLIPQAPKYKVYTALLNQTDTDAPVATVLENTLGDIVWSRDGIGLYRMVSNNLFIENKTFIVGGSEYIFNPGLISSSILDRNTILISCFDLPNTAYSDDNFVTTAIEIRVYN
jgi:hypothetical protein